MARKPNYLVPPCGRSKQDRINWLQNVCGRYRGGREYETPTSSGPWKFCWDVKLHRLDFSFEHLLEVGVAIEAVEAGNKGHISRGQENFDDMAEQNLWQWATIDAQRLFHDDNRGGVPGNHAFTSLWNGDNIFAEYQFMGRSGGWLVMTRILGLEMDSHICLDSLSYRQIRVISEVVWYVTNHLKSHPPERAVEEAAAWIIFN